MVKEINEKDFYEVIKNEKVLVDCYATWCGPCKMMAPIIEELAEDLKSINFYKLDVDENEKISQEFSIMSIPTLLYFENGQLKNTFVGLKSKEELKFLLK